MIGSQNEIQNYHNGNTTHNQLNYQLPEKSSAISVAEYAVVLDCFCSEGAWYILIVQPAILAPPKQDGDCCSDQYIGMLVSWSA